VQLGKSPLLQDIPTWLHSFRLQKYAGNLKDLSWKELVELDDGGLKKRGVDALSARRKMLMALYARASFDLMECREEGSACQKFHPLHGFFLLSLGCAFRKVLHIRLCYGSRLEEAKFSSRTDLIGMSGVQKHPNDSLILWGLPYRVLGGIVRTFLNLAGMEVVNKKTPYGPIEWID
jgi:hypothetical protein